MGEGWASWLHFEVHPDSVLHGRDVAASLADVRLDDQPVLRPGPTAALPLPPLLPDGQYGPRTHAAAAASYATLAAMRAAA